MDYKLRFVLVVLLGVTACAACTAVTPASPTPTAAMANPASVYCEQNAGKLELRQDASGGVAGWCVFTDGSVCDEWAYFRGECQPGGARVTPALPPTPAPTQLSPTVTAAAASDGWKIYRNEELGYSFLYPAEAQITENEDPSRSLSVTGPVIGTDNWPQFTISHPSDREDYRPPEGVDLAQWLVDHNLLGDQRLPDVPIAGTQAIHLRHERSPQSYAYDRYFFAKAGQLYMVVIGHAGDKEDWDLYQHFLASIQFAQ